MECSPLGAGPASADNDYILTFFNIPQPVPEPRSPTPSANSENSIECSPFASHAQPSVSSDIASSSSDDGSEQELTSLTWLTELRNQSLTWPDSVRPMLDDEDTAEKAAAAAGAKSGKGGLQSGSQNANGTTSATNSLVTKKPTPAERFNAFLDKVKKDLVDYEAAAGTYQTDTSEKPPFNYSHIIGMAMFENGRMTLQQICSWIEAKFAFFRVRKKWNNSIRHNLSLHHCFRKIDRSKYEKGKGGYWELGVDLKKCDRKRIRNRKNKKFASNLDRDATFEGLLTFDNVHHSDVVAAYGMDEDMPSDKVVREDMDIVQDIAFDNQSTENNNNSHNVNNNAISQNPIQLQDVFITDHNCKSYHITASAITVESSNQHTGGMFPTGLENQILLESDIPQACENVVVSSFLNNVPLDGPNVIVEQLQPYYTVPIDEANFRPYIDGIDEAFHYLRSTESRCDDLLDSLLDISVSDY